MQRYKEMSEVKVGDRVVFDNTMNIIDELQAINCVGEIMKIIDEENLLISFKLGSHKEPIEAVAPFYLLQ